GRPARPSHAGFEAPRRTGRPGPVPGLVRRVRRRDVAGFPGRARPDGSDLRPEDGAGRSRPVPLGRRRARGVRGGRRPDADRRATRPGLHATGTAWARPATALTAAVTSRWLDRGKSFCFLYTDRTNPTSNAIYRRVGYEPVCDAVDYRFERPRA